MPVVVSAKGRRFLNMYGQAQKFRQAIPAIEQGAAATATDTSRTVFKNRLSGRPIAPARSGRPSTEGRFASDILWERMVGASAGNIGVDLRRLPPYVFIQEIGTGQSARITNPPGAVSVRSQYGRLISANLYWASGPGGSAVPAQTGARDDQLYYASQLNAQTLANVRRRRKRIRREIKGKHFLGDGGNAGYLELRTKLTDEARRIFR